MFNVDDLKLKDQQNFFGNDNLLSPKLSPRYRALSEVNESDVKLNFDPDEMNHDKGCGLSCPKICLVCRQLAIIFEMSMDQVG